MRGENMAKKVPFEAKISKTSIFGSFFVKNWPKFNILG